MILADDIKPMKGTEEMVARQIVARHQAGESMNVLRREFHMGYPRLCAILEVFGVERREKWQHRRRDTRPRCSRCDVVLEECESWERTLERAGLCGDCAFLASEGHHFCVPIERFEAIVEGILG